MSKNEVNYSNKKKEILIAIDPSTTSLGYAIFQNGCLGKDGYYGCFVEKQKEPIDSRVDHISRKLFSLIEPYRDTKKYHLTFICEDAYVGKSINGSKHNYRLQGILIGCAVVLNADIAFIYPTQWRKILKMQKKGLKRNDYKPISVNYVKDKYGLDVPDDTSDAICIGDAYLIQKGDI